VLDLTPFQNLPLRGGFLLVETHLTAKPLLDPIQRAASAQTRITGRRFYILLRADLDERELSISLYHEVLEAATVAAETPPDSFSTLTRATSNEKLNPLMRDTVLQLPQHSTIFWQILGSDVNLLK
jgi:hypothetical protein